MVPYVAQVKDAWSKHVLLTDSLIIVWPWVTEAEADTMVL